MYEMIDKSPVNTDTDDYPDFAVEVAKAIMNKEADLGVLLCGTGIGMSIAANKIKGIRCGHCSSSEQAHLTKEHNHANLIALSYKQDINELIEMIKEFIETKPSTEERHVRRVNKIIEIEKNTYNEL
jgi:ribose 5-phosphate isomerase B